MTNLVTLVGVGKQYPSGSSIGLGARLRRRPSSRPWALSPVSLEIGAGRSIAILGRNGSGKSTLLGIAAGTVAPTVGQVVRNVDPTLLFQVGTAFDDELSGSENVRLELLLRGLAGPILKRAVGDAREFAEIDDAWDEPLRTYSAGMRARLALGAALADPGPLLLVDEILAVGDVGFVSKCIERFRALRARGAAILFVSHDAWLARELADEALLLDHGRPFASGNLEDCLVEYSTLTGIPL